MSLPQDIDYLSVPASLSQEVREILDRVRPSTVSLHIRSILYLKEISYFLKCGFVFQLGAATRLEGITPAAIVSLFNYVQFTKSQKMKREEELCARNVSLPQ